MEKIKEYIETLTGETLAFVCIKIIKKKLHIVTIIAEDSCCVGAPPQGLPPTPNGDWECGPDCNYVWVPET